MMGASTVYGLRRPEKAIELDVGNADRIDIVRSSYDLWCDATRSLHHRGLDCYPQQYEQACQILKPFADRIDGQMSTDEMKCVRRFTSYYQPGAFLSALLNETGLEKLTIAKTKDNLGSIGYKIGRGKTLETLEKVNAISLGQEAEGGVVINRGNSWFMGQNAVEGVFLNLRKVGELGTEASGIFVNCDEAELIGYKAADGIFVNCGVIQSSMIGGFGSEARGGVFATRTYPEKNTKWGPTFLNKLPRNAYVYASEPKCLKDDMEMQDLLDQIEHSSHMAEIAKITETARKIDEHVRKKYGPRMVGFR